MNPNSTETWCWQQLCCISWTEKTNIYHSDIAGEELPVLPRAWRRPDLASAQGAPTKISKGLLKFLKHQRGLQSLLVVLHHLSPLVASLAGMKISRIQLSEKVKAFGKVCWELGGALVLCLLHHGGPHPVCSLLFPCIQCWSHTPSNLAPQNSLCCNRKTPVAVTSL